MDRVRIRDRFRDRDRYRRRHTSRPDDLTPERQGQGHGHRPGHGQGGADSRRSAGSGPPGARGGAGRTSPRSFSPPRHPSGAAGSPSPLPSSRAKRPEAAKSRDLPGHAGSPGLDALHGRGRSFDSVVLRTTPLRMTGGGASAREKARTAPASHPWNRAQRDSSPRPAPLQPRPSPAEPLASHPRSAPSPLPPPARGSERSEIPPYTLRPCERAPAPQNPWRSNHQATLPRNGPAAGGTGARKEARGRPAERPGGPERRGLGPRPETHNLQAPAKLSPAPHRPGK